MVGQEEYTEKSLTVKTEDSWECPSPFLEIVDCWVEHCKNAAVAKKIIPVGNHSDLGNAEIMVCVNHANS